MDPEERAADPAPKHFQPYYFGFGGSAPACNFQVLKTKTAKLASHINAFRPQINDTHTSTF